MKLFIRTNERFILHKKDDIKSKGIIISEQYEFYEEQIHSAKDKNRIGATRKMWKVKYKGRDWYLHQADVAELSLFGFSFEDRMRSLNHDANILYNIIK